MIYLSTCIFCLCRVGWTEKQTPCPGALCAKCYNRVLCGQSTEQAQAREVSGPRFSRRGSKQAHQAVKEGRISERRQADLVEGQEEGGTLGGGNNVQKYNTVVRQLSNSYGG